MPDLPQDEALYSAADVAGSSCFAAAHYDEFTRTLHLRFRSGTTTYTWQGVPKSKWLAFKAASSKGRYYHAHIQGQYLTDYAGGGP